MGTRQLLAARRVRRARPPDCSRQRPRVRGRTVGASYRARSDPSTSRPCRWAGGGWDSMRLTPRRDREAPRRGRQGGRSTPMVTSRLRLVARFGLLLLLVLTACGQIPGLSRGGEVPRNRTLIITPWGPRPDITNPQNYHIYQSGVGHQREIGD